MSKDEEILRIARDVLGLETIQTRKRDQLDFNEHSVWSILRAIAQAYDAGVLATERMRKSTLHTNRQAALEEALRGLLKASDDLKSAIEGSTDQFAPEIYRLMDAMSAAEKALKGGAP